MTAAIARAIDADALDGNGSFIGRVGFELCNCSDCIAQRPERAKLVLGRSRPVRVFRPSRHPCPKCGRARGLSRGQLCRKCAP